VTFRVLHISDIHIGNTYKPPSDIAYQIVRDLENNHLNSIDSIVITGDIFDGRCDFESGLIDEAASFFEQLLSLLNSSNNIKKIEKTDFIFVPGNHDLVRNTSSNKYSKYRTFLEKFYGILPEFYLDEFEVFKPYVSEKILFIGFDTCSIEKRNVFGEDCLRRLSEYLDSTSLEKHGCKKDKLLEILKSDKYDNYFDYGHVAPSQMNKIKKQSEDFKDYNIVALFHHHFYLYPEIIKDFGSTGFIQNYTEFSHFLQNLNVSTILHGHKHFDFERPYITEKYYESPQSIFNIFSAGSLCLFGIERHTFNVLDFHEKGEHAKLTQHKFVYMNEKLDVTKVPIPFHHREINLLNMLENNELVAHSELKMLYDESHIDVHIPFKKIIEWIEQLFSSFPSSVKMLSEDNQNILFLAYSILYRLSSYQSLMEGSIFANELTKFEIFFDKYFVHEITSKEKYQELFKIIDLKEVTNKSKEIFASCNSREAVFLSYSMIGIYFTDLYLIFNKYADSFKHSIDHKVNIKISDNIFHKSVRLSQIKTDMDKRSIYLELFCTEAVAHKMAALFVKEFDLLLNNFEDYFEKVGFKTYYLIPYFHKTHLSDKLDNHNFEAYIPTLLPLLTGDNIYPTKLVFSRELIQNSIDAIAVRESKSNDQFSKEIKIEIGTDDSGRRFFKVTDHGSGMNRHKIERYFTSIGRSFYSDDDYKELKIDYQPISHFGIGFLSSFMVCEEIDVKTRHYSKNSESLKLHIPNYDGCFFIEKGSDFEIGTTIKLYLECEFNDEEIVEYIQKTMIDLRYDLSIFNNENTQLLLPAHGIRNKKNDFKFFIPFTESGDILKESYEKLLTENYMDQYAYGLLIQKHNPGNNNPFFILNAGILVENSSLESLFGTNDVNYKNSNFCGLGDEDETFNDIIMNFPSNWIQIDVSRGNITDFSDFIKKMNKTNKSIGLEIAENLYAQISEFLKYSTYNQLPYPVIYIEEVIRYSISFLASSDNDVYAKLLSMTYVVDIVFTPEGIQFEINHANYGINLKKDTLGISYENEQSKSNKIKYRNSIISCFLDITFSKTNLTNVVLRGSLKYLIKKSVSSPLLYGYFKNFVFSKNLVINDVNLMALSSIEGIEHLDDIVARIPLETLALLILLLPDEITTKDKEDIAFIQVIEKTLMKYVSISDVENGKNKKYVSYAELENYFNLKFDKKT
jgi:Molecular chaperone, HSP90 family